jgi:hypothetical protein
LRAVLGEEKRFYTVWVNLVTLTVCWSLPLFPDERAFSDTVGLFEGAARRRSRFAKMKEAAA